MKKILIFLFLVIFLVGTVSSFEFDNKLTYSKNDMKVNLTNWFGLGVDYGSAELKSHKNVNEIRPVIIGNSVLTWYDFDFKELYLNGLGQVFFTDMDSGKEIQKDYSFMYWGNLTEEKSIYSCSDVLSKNGTIGQDCVVTSTKSIISKRQGWIPYSSTNIPKGKIRIGVEAYIGMEETVDVVWSIGGKRVDKHAVVSSGAVETIDGDYTVLTYNNNGTFNVTEQNLNVTVLIIGGGGSGGGAYQNMGGGAGAGGLVYAINLSITGNFPIFVGIGGTKVPACNIDCEQQGYNGQNSSAFGLVAIAGGGAGGGASSIQDGLDGGSGGGAGWTSGGAGLGIQGNFSNATGFGRDGGGSGGGSGGGGANNIGLSGRGGNGGAGRTYSINGTLTCYAGGGGGGTDGASTGIATCGGGNGGLNVGSANGLNAINGTGGGGGGASYNGTGGITWAGGMGGNGIVIIRYLTSDTISAPTVNLDSPANNTNFTLTNNVIMNATIFDNTNITNVSLIIDDIYNETNTTSGLNNTVWTFNKIMGEGDFFWTMEACNFNGDCANGTQRTFNVNTRANINYGVGVPVNEANITNNFFEVNVTITEDLFKNITFDLYNVNGALNQSVTFTNSSRKKNWTNLPDATYSYNVTVATTTNQFNSTGTRNISVDNNFPQINISDPIDATNYPYLTYNDTFNLNVTVIDVNLDTCFYEYNSTNTSYSCSTGIQQNETFSITNQSDIKVWANDTFGNLNSSSVSWTFDLFDFNNYTYDTNITESSQTTFIGNFQTGSSISSAYLEYNNTNYSSSINSLGGNKYILSTTIISTTVLTDTNITWFYWVNNINATPTNQTVLSINLDNCGSYSNAIVYYYLRDELDQTIINNTNSTIESLVYLRTLGGENVAQFNQTFAGNSTPQICSEINLTNSNLKIWGQARYGSDNFVFEQHNIQNASMTTFANFTLLDLPSTSATTFRIEYKSETFLPVTDAVIDIQRKYIGEGVFKSTESPITDANGETSASLDLDSVIYRIIVRKDGITLSTFENPAIACRNILTGDCTINLNEKQTINLINTFDTINDFSYGLTQNNRTITLTFEIPSGASRSVNLFVNQSTILGNQTSCDQTLLATNGQIQCVIDETLGDVFASVKVSSDNTLITTASTTILEDRSQYFGTDNIILTFFLVLSLVLLMVSDPIAILVGLLIGLIAGGLMLFLNMGSLFGVTSILMYLIIIVILLIIKISNRQR